MPDPSEPGGPPSTSAPRLSPGETERIDGDIPVTIDGFLVRVFSRGGLDRAQVRIPSDEICQGSYQVVDVARKVVRVPPAIRGMKL